MTTILARLFLIAIPLAANGQHIITIDWAARTMANAPVKVDQPTPVKLKITNVNDFLYSSEAKIKYDPNTVEGVTGTEFDRMGLVMVGCATDDLAQKVADLSKPLFLAEPAAGQKCPSIPLKKSREDWLKLEPHYLAIEQTQGAGLACPSFKAYEATLQKSLREFAKIAAGPHEFSVDDILPGDGKYTVFVNEFCGAGDKRQVTEGGAYTASFYASTSRFFLSVGYLGSQISSRTYDTVVTGQQTTTTTNAAGVATTNTTEIKSLRTQGTGAWHPTAALLLNYKLPINKLMGERWGVAVSAGPAYRINTTGSGASNFGVFTGLSFHLWERLVLTPGIHLGTFSDTPLGFHRNGVFDPVVPPGITTLSPVSRPTTRFGIGITFQAADFKKGAALATFAANPMPPSTQTSNAPAPAAPPVAGAKPAAAPAVTAVPAAPPVPANVTTVQLKAAVDAAEIVLKIEKAELAAAQKEAADLDQKVAEATKALPDAADKPAAQRALDKLKEQHKRAVDKRAAAGTWAAAAQVAFDQAKTNLALPN